MPKIISYTGSGTPAPRFRIDLSKGRNLAHRKPDDVYCVLCDASGAGVQFPLLPKSNHKFGRICADCDEKEAK
jgi:hypothetical protein